ncbi:MAG: glycosyltransferase [Deltaproteobacteria bacterium]|nr:glycosyltransferase [Deltaproteobacteria bacterium]
MRILLLAGSYPPMKCGVGDYTGRLAEALGALEGVSVAVLTEASAASSPGGKGVTLFPVAGGWTFPCAASILRTMISWKPDLVHIQYPAQGYRGSFLSYQLPLLARASGFPVVQTWHEYKPVGSITVIANALPTRGFIVVRPDFESNSSPFYRWIFRHRPFRLIPNAPSIPVIPLSRDQRECIRREMAPEAERLIVYFGFASRAKNVEALFDIADPGRDHIVLACDLDPSDPYHATILENAGSARWKGKTTITGYLPPDGAGRILSAADAVVLPFREGGGDWNSSIRGASVQGTFVLTTSRERNGFDAEGNIYFAEPGNPAELRQALALYAGRRAPAQDPVAAWDSIARSHVRFYREMLGISPPEEPA